MKNDFSRIHVDDLRGEVERVDISILYYLCDQWFGLGWNIDACSKYKF